MNFFETNIPFERITEFVSNHQLLFLALFVVTVLLIKEVVEGLLKRYKVATPMKAVAILNHEDTTLLNVSETGEYDKGHIDGSLHIPLSKLDQRLYELEKKKAHPIVVTCWTGMHSAQACTKLAKLGFEQVFHLKGGIQAWQDENLPTVGKKK